MSHIAEIKTEVRDLDALEAACQRLGGTLKRGQKSYRWYGRWVGDTPLPADTNVKELGQCDHAMVFPGCSYDVGVVRRGDRFILRWDWFSAGGLLSKLGGNEAPKLVQAYAIEKAKLEARRAGHRNVREEQLKDGSIRLIITQR